MADRPPRTAARLAAATAVALFAGGFALSERLRVPTSHSDFSPVWFGAKALLQHRNPYALVGPALEFKYDFPLNYPATALVAAIPFTALSETVATVLFVVISGWLLGFAITRETWNRIWIIPSSAFVIASRAAQWSPIIAAAVFLPWLAWIFCCKPTLGLAVVGATSRKRSLEVFVLGSALLLVISLALMPNWPIVWIRNIASGGFTSPVIRLGGIAILFAGLRWRRPEARLLLLLALVPQTSSWYEGLLPMIVGESKREVQFLSLISSAGYMLQIPLLSDDNFITAHDTGALIVAFCYLPAVIVLLRKRNEGELPAWLQFLKPANRISR